MHETVNPQSIRPPFGNYSHGVSAPPGRMLFASGQLGVRSDDSVPEDIEAQAEICFENIGAILREAGMAFADVVKLSAFVTARADMAAYMRVRDRYVSAPLPTSTLMIVSGFTRPEFLVEVEAIAVGA
ncbi:MAG: RidA family protein [Alphaproteobacteria bacterium]